MDNFDVKLLKRRIGSKRIHQSIRPLYGDRRWAQDLDIVNELGGHTGCVNALSWSKSGALLASGSDDTYLNIWSYNPAEQARPVTLNTSVSTGHHANIFSVKFMPHSNDRTVVTCAGDSEVRVFDLEYGGGVQTGAEESTRSRRFEDFFSGTRWLTHANTNARVYRSHADRAKRVVTESSPYLFLSCSEDGEVRQWDLRQPSSAYPPPRDGRRWGFRRVQTESEVGESPPPLISYKAYGLDLNSISCSGSQPHYIALGGAHLHCFLHDRRMLGRNVSAETGRPVARPPMAGSIADDEMREATKCVRRFAPENKYRMRPGDAGHITACKISDARPNELISSWSGDHIYSFDIAKGPDARDADTKADLTFQKAYLRNFTDRKRKRAKITASSSSIADGVPTNRRLRKVSDDTTEQGRTALRARYETGETEGLQLNNEDNTLSQISHDSLSEPQRLGRATAKAIVDLRKTLFDFSTALTPDELVATEQSTELSELTPHTSHYTNSLGQASALLPGMEQIMRDWRYPVDPDEDEIDLQNTLRRNRQASWRFVQAAGCLSKSLGGKLQTVSSSKDSMLNQFRWIKTAPREASAIQDQHRFCYDFLKAILAWLVGGKNLVLDTFKKPPELRESSPRFPLEQNDTVDTFVPKLKNYLLSLARDDTPIIDLGTNRFERDELRNVFQDQKSAVQAFARALENIELRFRQGPSELIHVRNGSDTKRIMDRGAAARFWGEKVGRSLLMTAAEGVSYEFVSGAFGGLDMDASVDLNDLIPRASETLSDTDPTTNASDTRAGVTIIEGEADSEMSSAPRLTVEDTDEVGSGRHVFDADEQDDNDDNNESSHDENDNENDDDDDDDDDDDEDDEDDGEATLRHIYHRRGGYGSRQSLERAKVNLDVPYTSHTKVYKGHCNTRTVKDVNYYGLDDEYVISGSDDGRFFIWDRKTCQIVNILEGDNEVVNVIQGHPYEPMIACSGIDSTIKIFGPGNGSRERAHAAKGVNIANPGIARHSSLADGLGRRSRPHHALDTIKDDEDHADESTSLLSKTDFQSDPDEEDEKVTKNGLSSRRIPPERFYEIQSQNNAQRRQGTGDAFITQGMLARFAAALHRGEIQVGQGLGEGGGTIVIDDNCTIM